jgi:hypothetical protein
MTKQIVGYIRVSTAQQGKSGLGLAAQREALVRFAAAEDLQIAARQGDQTPWIAALKRPLPHHVVNSSREEILRYSRLHLRQH